MTSLANMADLVVCCYLIESLKLFRAVKMTEMTFNYEKEGGDNHNYNNNDRHTQKNHFQIG